MIGNTSGLAGPLALISLQSENPYAGVISFTILLFVCILYILESVGVMKIAQKYEIKHSWLALVPVLGLYTMGRVAFDSKVKATLLLIMYIVFELVNSLAQLWSIDLSIISLLCQIATRVIYFCAIYKIYKKMSDRAISMLIFSILSDGILAPIFIFSIRKNKVLKKQNS